MKLLIDPAMPNHPKVHRLASALGVNAREARGIILSLWAWTMTYHENGSLVGVSPAEIATAADWPPDRDAGGFLSTLISVGLLDQTPLLAVHDWHEQQGPLLAKREKERKKKAKYRAGRKAREDRTHVPSKAVRAVPPSGGGSPMRMSTGTLGDSPPGTEVGTSTSAEGKGKEGTGREGNGRVEDEETTPPKAPTKTPLTATEQAGIEQVPQGSPEEQHPVPQRSEKEQRSTRAREVTQRLVELWNSDLPKGSWISVTPMRIGKVKARLEKFTEEQLRLVVVRLKESAWHSGQGPSGWKAPGPEWVLWTTEKVEEWIARGDGHGRNGTPSGGNGTSAKSPGPRAGLEACAPRSLSVGADIGKFFKRPAPSGSA